MNVYIPDQVLGQGYILPTEAAQSQRSGSGFYEVSGLPNKLARNSVRANLADLAMNAFEWTHQGYNLAAALLDLSDNYGIHFPGVGSLLTTSVERNHPAYFGHILTVANVVEGANLRDFILDVPREVVLGTFQTMLKYYEDMSYDYSDKLYLADVSLRQCMYGKIRDSDDHTPRVYFVDYDPHLNNISNMKRKDKPIFGNGFGGIPGLDGDLSLFTEIYPDLNIDSYAERLLAIANVQGIFYKVPTAYDHVNGVR